MRATRRGALAIPIVLVILVCLAASTAAEAAAEDWDWNYNLVLGRRNVGAKEWAPFRGYGELGAEMSWGKADEPLMFATDLYASQDTKRVDLATVQSDSLQACIGLRKIWTFGKRWHPYGGAGLTVARVKAERPAKSEIEDSSDISEGLWVGGGLFYRAGTHMNLGLAARVSLMRNYRIFGVDHGGNATHIGFVIGWGAERSGEN